MQRPDATMRPRRSTRIQENVARQKVKDAERIANLEAESRAPEKSVKPNTTLKRKRPGQKLTSKAFDSAAETEAGAEGESNLPAETVRPKKKQKTALQQNETDTEFQDTSTHQEQHTAPLLEKETLAEPASVAEGQNTAPQQDEASTEFQHMSANKEEHESAPQQNETGAEAQDKPTNKEGQADTPLVEEQDVVEQAAFKQAVVNQDQDTTRQQDQATAALQDTSGDREERVLTSFAEEGVLAGEDYKNAPQQNEGITEVRKMPADPKEATTPLVDKRASLDEGRKFLKVLNSIVLIRRQLRRKRAARRKCPKERSELEWLLDYNWSQLANVPPEETHPGVRHKLRADIERFERNLDHRQEQEYDLDKDIKILNQSLNFRKRRMDDLMAAEVPPDSLPPSMKDSADFREVYKYCRSLVHIVKDIEARLRDAEREREAILDRYYSHAGQGAELDEVGSHDQALRDGSGPDSRCIELERDASRTKMMCSAQKLALATLAENDLVERRMLQPYVSDGEESKADPEEIEQQEKSKQAAAKPSEAEKSKAERDAAKAELMSAQAHLCTAYKEFQERRYLTEEEFAQLPKTITEDDIGLELQMKLMRTTRNYIEAQERVRTAQAECRRLGVPGVDKYPIDQTWNFEDRPDDGYAESVIADRVEKSRPRVKAWLSRIAMSGKPFTPSTNLKRRRKWQESFKSLQSSGLEMIKQKTSQATGRKSELLDTSRLARFFATVGSFRWLCLIDLFRESGCASWTLT